MTDTTVVQPGTVAYCRLHEVLDYDPGTGAFRWRVGRSNRKAGGVAGSVSNRGYTVISIDGKVYLAHRLAFLYMTGSFPPGLVDHIDRVRTNNAWSNLRNADCKQNCQNQGRRSDNTSGFTGVSWNSDRKKWRARIYIDDRQISLGRHNTAEEAFADYARAKAKYHTFQPEAAR